MRNQIKIEGGGKGGWEPKQVYEKNLSYLSGYNVISGFHQGVDFKTMQDAFVIVAPRAAGLSLANLKTWNDRNTNNTDSKLSKEKPLRAKKPLPAKPLSPELKRIKTGKR